jgi:hypothetical protein
MRICLAGDSFAWGVWGQTDDRGYTNLSGWCDEHPGLQQHLEQDGHTVDICGLPSGGLNDSILYLKDYLKLSHNPDIIYMFVTDPFRNAHCNTSTRKEIIEQRDAILHEYVVELDSLEKNIQLIGGVQYIRPAMIEGLVNVSIACESVYELANPEFTHHDVIPATTLRVTAHTAIDEETLSWLEDCQGNIDRHYVPPICPPHDSHPSSYTWALLHKHLNLPKSTTPRCPGEFMYEDGLDAHAVFNKHKHAKMFAYKYYMANDVNPVMNYEEFTETHPEAHLGPLKIIEQKLKEKGLNLP